MSYSDRCVVCGELVTEATPATLLAAMVEHYDGHGEDQDDVGYPWCYLCRRVFPRGAERDRNEHLRAVHGG